MTTTDAAKILPAVQAFAEGKAVQVRSSDKADWQDSSSPTFHPDLDWRVKPEPREWWLVYDSDTDPTNHQGNLNADANTVFATADAALANLSPASPSVPDVTTQEPRKSLLASSKIAADGVRYFAISQRPLWKYENGIMLTEMGSMWILSAHATVEALLKSGPSIIETDARGAKLEA
jgi:hypothetical protein